MIAGEKRAMLRFDRFALDPADRRLTRDGVPVELNSRYLDALALLAGEAGQLVTKDRFLSEVWRGVPVTDEALTQCVRSLRRALGDDAARPRFIETVPKHGYRFVAAVTGASADITPATVPPPPVDAPWRRALALAAAGTLGGGVAGVAVGLFYGLGGASQPLQPGMGAASVLVVLVCLSIAAGLIAGAGVGGGIGAAEFARAPRWQWSVLGGAAGGVVMGTAARLVGLDAFALLLGHSPGDITGALEGGLSGAAVGLAAWLGLRLSFERTLAVSAAAGALIGTVIPLLGGRLMGGSLDLLARQFADSRLRLDRFGALLGEPGFGLGAQVLTGAVEGAAFVTGVAGAVWLVRRMLSEASGRPN